MTLTSDPLPRLHQPLECWLLGSPLPTSLGDMSGSHQTRSARTREPNPALPNDDPLLLPFIFLVQLTSLAAGRDLAERVFFPL